MPRVSVVDKRTRWRIAAHVRRVMTERTYSQADVCRRTGIAAGNLSKLLSGIDDRVGLDTFIAIHRGLMIDANVLADDDPPAQFFLPGQHPGRSGQKPGRGEPYILKPNVAVLTP